MAIQVYNFNNFDGYVQVNEYPDHEFRIYFKGKTNTLATICYKKKTENEFYLYNFILDKEHLQNLRKDKEVHWFHGISGLILYVDKLTPEITKFLNYALEYKVNVTLLNKPDWGEPI